MTIPHADLIRAVLDGKTVQWAYSHRDRDLWQDLNAVSAIIELTKDTDAYIFRLKPEPRCVWSCHDKNGDHWFAVKPKGGADTILRHEFDPNTGEYLRTVKEDQC